LTVFKGILCIARKENGLNVDLFTLAFLLHSEDLLSVCSKVMLALLPLLAPPPHTHTLDPAAYPHRNFW